MEYDLVSTILPFRSDVRRRDTQLNEVASSFVQLRITITRGATVNTSVIGGCNKNPHSELTQGSIVPVSRIALAPKRVSSGCKIPTRGDKATLP